MTTNLQVLRMSTHPNDSSLCNWQMLISEALYEIYNQN